MIKQLLLPFFIFSSLFAKDIEEMDEIVPLDPEVVQSLYIESALFVTVVILMSVISIVISKKHAAQNVLDDKKKREERKEAEKRSQPSFIKEPNKTKRVEALSKMLEDGLITDEEFQALSAVSKAKPN